VSQSSKFYRHNPSGFFQRVFIVVYFVIDSVPKLLDTPSCTNTDWVGKRLRCIAVTCPEGITKTGKKLPRELKGLVTFRIKNEIDGH
jgi:hypothetical protein